MSHTYSPAADLTGRLRHPGAGMDHSILMLCGHKPKSKAGAVFMHGLWLRCAACEAKRKESK